MANNVMVQGKLKPAGESGSRLFKQATEFPFTRLNLVNGI